MTWSCQRQKSSYIHISSKKINEPVATSHSICISGYFCQRSASSPVICVRSFLPPSDYPRARHNSVRSCTIGFLQEHLSDPNEACIDITSWDDWKRTGKLWKTHPFWVCASLSSGSSRKTKIQKHIRHHGQKPSANCCFQPFRFHWSMLLLIMKCMWQQVTRIPQGLTVINIGSWSSSNLQIWVSNLND